MKAIVLIFVSSYLEVSWIHIQNGMYWYCYTFYNIKDQPVCVKWWGQGCKLKSQRLWDTKGKTRTMITLRLCLRQSNYWNLQKVGFVGYKRCFSYLPEGWNNNWVSFCGLLVYTPRIDMSDCTFCYIQSPIKSYPLKDYLYAIATNVEGKSLPSHTKDTLGVFFSPTKIFTQSRDYYI